MLLRQPALIKRMKIDGKEIAQRLLYDLKKKVISLHKKDVYPKLVILTVQPSTSILSFINQKLKACQFLGIKTAIIRIEKKINEKRVLKIIKDLNSNPTVHGIIVQLPLPDYLDTKILIKAVAPLKDIDGFLDNSRFSPPIGLAILKILGKIPDFSKRKILIVGRGVTGGYPIAKTLGEKRINYSIAHSKTKNIEKLTRESNIIISCVGKPHVIKPKMLLQGSVLIGVGDWQDKKGKVHGDYDDEEVEKVVSYYTPTPGGVGPVNVACLMENLVKAAEKSKTQNPKS